MAEGVFENDCLGYLRCITRFTPSNVPRENAPRLIHLFLNVPCGTITLKQARLEKIPKYLPLRSLRSKVRYGIVYYSQSSFLYEDA